MPATRRPPTKEAWSCAVTTNAILILDSSNQWATKYGQCVGITMRFRGRITSQDSGAARARDRLMLEKRDVLEKLHVHTVGEQSSA